MKKPPAIFFDLDGTLTDPKEGITRCIQYALEKLDRPVLSTDELTWCIGPPLLKNFETLVGIDDAARGVELYRERFSEIGWRENVPYPGVNSMLKDLSEDGFDLYLATSKPHVFANRILEYFDLAPRFTRAFGAELDGTHSDKTELIEYALGEISPSTVVAMVGDRSHDVVGAANNNLPSIGVSYGYGGVQELTDAGATVLANTPEEVLLRVKELT